MTTYTADDFTDARFATRGPENATHDKYVSRDVSCWQDSEGNGFTDSEMARDGWVPVLDQEARNHRGTTLALHSEIQAILTAALAEPKPRPEGAEGVECALLDADEAGVLASDQERIERLADFLAERGVRVTGGQS